MEPLIFDTSVWIDFLNGKPSTGNTLLSLYLNNDSPIVLTPTIVQEVLQGIGQDKEYERVKSNLLSFSLLEIEAYKAATGAAHLYRDLRKKGVTIRKANDCLIAYYAIHHNIGLVHNDLDFDSIGANSLLKARRE